MVVVDVVVVVVVVVVLVVLCLCLKVDTLGRLDLEFNGLGLRDLGEFSEAKAGLAWTGLTVVN